MIIGSKIGSTKVAFLRIVPPINSSLQLSGVSGRLSFTACCTLTIMASYSVLIVGLVLLVSGAFCDSICDRYSDLLNVTNEELVREVVVDVFDLATQPTSPLLQFFDGTTPPGSTDYLNATNQDLLVPDNKETC